MPATSPTYQKDRYWELVRLRICVRCGQEDPGSFRSCKTCRDKNTDQSSAARKRAKEERCPRK